MSRREVLRRVALWAIVAVYFAASITLAFAGEWIGLVGFSAFPVVGAIILVARPRNGIGWYLMGVGLLSAIIMWTLAPSYAATLPAWLESAINALAGGFWILLCGVGVIFPTGRPQTRLGRVAGGALLGLAAASAAVALLTPGPQSTTGRENPFGIPALADVVGVATAVVNTVWIAVTALIVVDLVLRWRRASSIARLQYRWFALSLSAVVVVLAVATVVVAGAPDSIYDDVFLVIATVMFNLIPISIGIAVTRHGLYEINRIVSRTVSYAAVTVLVVGVYAGVVTSVTALVPGLPSMGVALATLAAAALFLPALRRIQRAVDRRFDRERYDAQRVVDAFGERLRTQLDPAATGTDLIAAVDRTLQPTAAGVWASGGSR